MTGSGAVAVEVVAAARAASDTAAERSHVRIRSAHTLTDVRTAQGVVDRVWHESTGDSGDRGDLEPMLWAMVHIGNYCAIAYDTSTDGELPIGVCIGFLGLQPVAGLHSHAAGVTGAGAGRNIGFALKQHQRTWALERGIDTITWTYDPLIRRNAFFNLTRLGARPVGYLLDFYGDMTDEINAGQGSDRLMLEWDLTSPTVIRCATRTGPEPPSADAREALQANGVRFVQVPPDIERMRADNPDRARQWRHDVRQELGGLMESGWSVVSISRDGYYELRSNA